MSDRIPLDYIIVPVSLLLTEELLPTYKIVWMELTRSAGLAACKRLSPTRISHETGFSRDTIRKAIAALKAYGWYSEDANTKLVKLSSDKVRFPIDLYLDRTLTVQARLLHGTLQIPKVKGKIELTRYSQLKNELNRNVKTIRKSIKQLAQKGWLELKQVNQQNPISLLLRNPVREAFDVMMKRVEWRLQIARWTGEAIMREFLSLLVKSDEYIDDAKPGYLENPDTGMPLQLDRYYHMLGVAFEFNGTQHYRSTDMFDEVSVSKQRRRDETKTDLCNKRAIKLIVVTPQDLSLSGMLTLIRDLLPLRCLRGSDKLVEFLERRSAVYRRNSPGLLPSV